MPNKTLKIYADESGKSLAEVEKLWEECKASANDKFEEKDERYWAWVNTCTRKKCGLKSEHKKSVIHKW